MLSALPSFAAMKLRFEPGAIVASGVTPGAKTVWMTVSHDPLAYRFRVITRTSAVTDDDNDGVVRLALDKPLRDESVWIVVDMSSGDRAFDTPRPEHVHRLPLPAASIHGKGNGRRAGIDWAAKSMAFWCVRPGVGAWSAVLYDGEPDDGDGRFDGRLSSALPSMQAVDSDAAPPEDFRPGDIVVAVDLFRLDTFDVRVTP